ncbi:MAG: sugar-binding protein [Planctomycetota bacterium]|nr:sugar-binding protein [Planctomycetota bacterium]MDA1223291.1 sugar-binding protein [Planctomycetota bacterium]
MYRVLALLVSALFLTSCGDSRQGQPRVAFITNCVADFWRIGEAGARAAGAEFGVEVDVRMPPNNDPFEQKQMVEDVLTRGAVGIAISPIDPANQLELLDAAAARVPLVTHDSDAPDSGRRCYVGMDNYEAGRMAAELVRQALPDGGTVALFVGNLAQDNARGRRQGVIDGLLGRERDRARFDAPDAELEGQGFRILGTLTDNADAPRAKSNAEDVLSRVPDLDAMVGLFAYNGPMCLEALRQVGKLGAVKVIAFDEDAATLRGIRDGHIVGTIVQDPFRYGYESVRIAAALAAGDNTVLPPSGFVDVPARRVDARNVDAFEADLRERLGGGR